MAGNDISSLIQDIYDRYKENQKDKKPEEQMYMSEEEFKANLKSMVNKSDIEDKFMLYNEIYLHITEDALEIDTTGNITISPKVIVNAEKEVIRRLEEHKNVENSKIGITEVVVGKTILDMTKEEYDKLSREQKKEVFVNSTEAFWGSKEAAENAYENLDSIRVCADEEKIIEATEKIQNGDVLTQEEYEKMYPNEIYIKDNDYQAIGLQIHKAIVNIASIEGIDALFETDENNMSVVDKDLITILIKGLDEGTSLSATIECLNGHIKDEKRLKKIEQLMKQPKKYEATIRLLDILGSMTMDRGGRIADLSKEQIQEYAKSYNALYKGTDIFEQIEILSKELETDADISDNMYTRVDNIVKTNNQIRDTLKETVDSLRNLVEQDYNYIGWEHSDNGNANRRVIGEITVDKTGRKNMFENLTGINLNQSGTIADMRSKYFGTVNVTTYGDFEKLQGLLRDKNRENNGNIYIGGNVVDKTKTEPEPEITEDVVEMEGDFEADLAAISDMQPDMFAGMFESMAEEMVVDAEQPVVETEKQEQTVPEIDSTEERSDNPILQNKGVQITDSTVEDNLVQGIQIEDIAIDENVTKTMSNENLPKKITWVDKVRASVDAFGKNVKKVFGNFISAITGKSGENNTGTNNTTTTSSSNAGQNKPVQEFSNFVPTVVLNLKQAQQATKAAEEAKKNNDARGNDEPTQDDSELGG